MLSRDVLPVNYEIELDVDMKKFRYLGKETITLGVKKSTNSVTLHAVGLKIKSCMVDGVKAKTARKDEDLIVTLPKKIGKKASMTIEFEGLIPERLSGFYRSAYKHNGKTKHLATTQFEPADARRMIPCFDEPAHKATFDLTVVIDKDSEAISNMPVARATKEGSRKRWTFETTPKMSTYLLYLGIGNFDFVEGALGKTKIRVAVPPGKREQGRFALEECKKYLDFFNKYYGIKYPLPKLDLVSIPDFASGAMENWGAVTFREVILLYDPKSTSTYIKLAIAKTLAHELAHMWFGDLVTMEWWNDLWLNESFATWMAYKALDHYYPEWEVWPKFTQDEVGGGLSLDALRSSHPIEVSVKTPNDVNQIFDAISYNKGGSVLRMLEAYLGEAAFRKGLHDYLKKHAHANATADDLWDALGRASKKPVRQIMDGWIKKTGHPIIEVKRDGNAFVLEQKRFTVEPVKDETKWTVPIVYERDGRRETLLMKDRTMKIKGGSYVKLNLDQTGFYRVQYDERTLEKLKELVSEKRLSNVDRWGLLDNMYAQIRACRVPLTSYLSFIGAYANEDDALVCQEIADSLYALYCLTEGSTQESIRRTALRFYKRVHERLGWDVRPKEKIGDKILRASTLVYSGRMGEASVLEEARPRFEAYVKNPSSVHPDIRAPVLRLAAWQGDKSVYETMKKLYMKSDNAEEKRRLLSTLACFPQPEIITESMDFGLSSHVRSNEAPLTVVFANSSPAGRKLVWPWVQKNWPVLVKRYGDGHDVKILEDFVESVGGLTTFEDERAVKAFFKKNDASMIKMTLDQTLERIRINARFLEYNQ